MEKNLILIGLGPHARRNYYPLLEKYAQQYSIKLRLLVDLQDQEERIQRYLAERSLQPERMAFADPLTYRLSERLNGTLRPLLDEVAAQYPIDGIIIATEPKAHKAYAAWAIEKGIDILLDKPITAPVGVSTDPDAARRIYDDYEELNSLLEGSRSRLMVQCQRRSHPGFTFVKNYLADFVRKFRIPLSYVDIYHADGMWPMPGELFERENHPYKYGYGKLMHSGYHLVDLFTWLSEVNDALPHKKPDRAEVYVRRFSGYDFLHQVDVEDYRRLFKTGQFDAFFNPAKLQAARSFGELDVFVLGQLMRGDVVVTTASINLQQNSFSRRAWTHTPEDVYKGNGRLRHERLSVQVGNLLNLQVHSYQSYETHRRDVDTEGAGHEDHFDIYIFRNSGVVGGQPLEKIGLGEAARRAQAGDASYLGHNENAKEINFVHFLEGNSDGLGLATHRLTNKLLSYLYQCIVAGNSGDVPLLSFGL
jgi:predicted dehydrogenase